MSDTCSSCGAGIVWAKTKNDKRVPLDIGAAPYEGDPRGLFAVVMGHTDRIALSLSSLPKEVHGRVVPWRSHFATCPHADQHRRKK